MKHASPLSFSERIAAAKSRLETDAARTPLGPERNALTEKLRQLDVAASLNELLSAPPLLPVRRGEPE